MYSSRLQWDARPNRLAIALQARRAARAEVLDLTESNPTRAGFVYPAEEILAALADPRSLAYEPAPAGLPEAREAVARHHGVAPERVLLTASTSESYSYLFKLLANPGDEVLTPRPSYPLFDYLAALESVRVAHYPLEYHGAWSVDLDALERAVTGRTRAVIVVNPNNPTGSFLKRHEMERLARLGLPIVTDEVFADYSFGRERACSLAGVEGAFTLSGLSKVAGLPQIKAGWIIAPPPAIERLELIADTYLSISTPVQHALPRLLAAGAAVREQIGRRVREHLDWLRAAIRAAPACELLDVEGGWYATLRVPRTRGEEEWCLELLDRGVLVQPGFFYDFEREAFLVISLLTRPEIFREGVSRLIETLERSADERS